VSGFTQVLNDLITDNRINATAFRVAVYLASKPDDWTTRERDVCKSLGLSRATYFRARGDLAKAGYMTSAGKPKRDAATGRFRTEPPKLIKSQVTPSLRNRMSVIETLNNKEETDTSSPEVSNLRLGNDVGVSQPESVTSLTVIVSDLSTEAVEASTVSGASDLSPEAPLRSNAAGAGQSIEVPCEVCGQFLDPNAPDAELRAHFENDYRSRPDALKAAQSRSTKPAIHGSAATR